jgi:hypothetical protein
VVVVVAALVVAGLGYAGVIDLPFFSKPLALQHSGIKVPVAARYIQAFTRVGFEHLYDMKTQDVAHTYLSEKEMKESGFLLGDKIIGRVLAHDKAPLKGFTEADFLPEGTREGIVAGVPLGKRSFVVQADQISGVHVLKVGDHVDILATLPVDLEKSFGHLGKNAMTPALAQSLTSMSGLPKRARVKPLVQDGVMVMALTTREVPLPGAQRNGKPQTKPVQEVAIAVAPAEVALLTEALAVHAEIFCVAHSGLPNDTPSITPGSTNQPQYRVVETISGSKRDILIFPKPNAGPQRPAGESETPPAAAQAKEKDTGGSD